MLRETLELSIDHLEGEIPGSSLAYFFCNDSEQSERQLIGKIPFNPSNTFAIQLPFIFESYQEIDIEIHCEETIGGIVVAVSDKFPLSRILIQPSNALLVEMKSSEDLKVGSLVVKVRRAENCEKSLEGLPIQIMTEHMHRSLVELHQLRSELPRFIDEFVYYNDIHCRIQLKDGKCDRV